MADQPADCFERLAKLDVGHRSFSAVGGGAGGVTHIPHTSTMPHMKPAWEVPGVPSGGARRRSAGASAQRVPRMAGSSGWERCPRSDRLDRHGQGYNPKMSDAAVVAPRSSARSRIGAYVQLTKPRIIELLLITTVPSMVLAARGWPGTALVVWTLVGGTLSAGGANAINNYLDRDIDEVMRRTSQRPLPQHDVEPVAALRLGVVLGVAGFVVLAVSSNLLAAGLSTGALLFYVFVYTLYLKRSTVQNIVIGGAAGAAPALVGWAAVTGSLALPAWLMFAIVFFWTPPHFWALSLKYKDDYAAAGVPMLPVVRGVDHTTRQIMIYTAELILVSLLLVPAAELSWVYLIASFTLGGGLMIHAYRVARDPSRAMKMFGYSNIYLAALFAAVWVDVLVG